MTIMLIKTFFISISVPLEYLSLFFNMPYMLLLSDVRQGIFYAMLLSFWLVFAGEHMVIQDAGKRKFLMSYYKHLSAVALGCFSLFVFDLCERGIRLSNPFFYIWMSTFGSKMASCFIIIAALSALAYFSFLCFMIWKVFRNISMKKISLSSMSAVRRLHYEGIIYRFQFLMLATLVCAALTIGGFILGQFAEGQWKWNDNFEIEYTSAIQTGTFGMWNIYIVVLVILYAPSHKQWPASETDNSIGKFIF